MIDSLADACCEGNRRSGIALAMRHRLSGLSTYGLKGQYAGDEHPAYASGHGPLPLPDACSLNLWGLGELLFLLQALLFGPGVIVAYPHLICYYVPHKHSIVQLQWVINFNLHFIICINSLSVSSQAFREPAAQCTRTFVINKCLCKIVLTVPVLMPTVSAKWRTLFVCLHFCNSIVFFRQLHH